MKNTCVVAAVGLALALLGDAAFAGEAIPAGAAPTDLAVTLTDGPDPAGALLHGLTYHAVVTNHGPAAAIDVEIVIPIPAGTYNPGPVPPCVVEIGLVRCRFAQVAIGASVEGSVVVLPGSDAPSLLAPAPTTVTALNPEVDPSDNSATTTTTIWPTAIPLCALSGAPEGDSGINSWACPVHLLGPHDAPVEVQYTFVGETALAGVDFVPESGVLTFGPGESQRDVAIDVIGDTRPEGNDVFRVGLSSATAFEYSDSWFVIRDDDAPLGRELTHGLVRRGDFVASDPMDRRVEFFHIQGDGRASFEVVVDEISGSAGPVHLGAIGGSDPTWYGYAPGTGSAKTIWTTNSSFSPDPTRIWVESLGCGSACGSGDRYRLRAHETTLVGGRYRNDGNTTTVVLLQNSGSIYLEGTVHFWREGGIIDSWENFSLGPHASRVLNVGTIPGLGQASGSITVSHKGSYGVLVGKSVVLDYASGVAFDSILASKPR